MTEKVFLNGRILPARLARVSVFDHGFLYGDGIYETVRVYDGQVFCWNRHFKRLQESARRLALRCPWPSAYLEKSIQKIVLANKRPTASVRITIARGPGPLGLNPEVCLKPTLAMMLHPDRPLERLQRDGVSVVITQVRRMHPLCLDPRIKSNNSLNTVFAKMEALRAHVFEAVLLNLDGYLTEGTTSNVFMAKRGRLMTPAPSCGILEGVTRETVIALARKEGIRVMEGRYRASALRESTEIFLTSTTLEIVPVIRVVFGTKTIWKATPGPLTRTLQSCFKAYRQLA